MITPTQVVKYLGIVINSIDLTLSIDDDKVSRVKDCVNKLRDKKWCPRKLLEQAAGLLAHCSMVVKGGSDCRRVALDELAILDLRWWSTFLVTFNGKARMFDKSDTNHRCLQ